MSAWFVWNTVKSNGCEEVVLDQVPPDSRMKLDPSMNVSRNRMTVMNRQTCKIVGGINERPPF